MLYEISESHQQEADNESYTGSQLCSSAADILEWDNGSECTKHGTEWCSRSFIKILIILPNFKLNNVIENYTYPIQISLRNVEGMGCVQRWKTR